MKNNLDYYSHKTNAHTHWKFKTLRKAYAKKFNIYEGWAGEAKFWVLNSWIAEAEDCRLNIANGNIFQELAADMDFSVDEMHWFLGVVINDTELAYREGDYLLTETTQGDLAKVMAKRKLQSEWVANKRARDERKKQKKMSNIDNSNVDIDKPNVDSNTGNVNPNSGNTGQSGPGSGGAAPKTGQKSKKESQAGGRSTSMSNIDKPKVDIDNGNVDPANFSGPVPPGSGNALNSGVTSSLAADFYGENAKTDENAGGSGGGFSSMSNIDKSKVDIDNGNVETGFHGIAELRTFQPENDQQNAPEMLSQTRRFTTNLGNLGGVSNIDKSNVDIDKWGNGIDNGISGVRQNTQYSTVQTITDINISVPKQVSAGVGSEILEEKPDGETHSPRTLGVAGGANPGSQGGGKIAGEGQNRPKTGVSSTVEGNDKGGGGKRALKSKKKNPDSEPHWQRLIATTSDFYKENFEGRKITFRNSENPKRLKEIVQELRFRAEDDKIEWTEEVATKQLHDFLSTAFQDKWLREHFLLSNINKQKDKVFLNLISHGTQLQTGSSQQGTSKSRGKGLGTSDARIEGVKNWSIPRGNETGPGTSTKGGNVS